MNTPPYDPCPSGAACGSTPRPSAQACWARRERVAAAIGDDALVLFGGQARSRSADTEFPFRPDSDFYYLTGLSEPGAVMVLRPGHDPRFVLFVRERNREAELWSGTRVGPDGAKDRFGADAAYPLAELEERLPALLDGVAHVHAPPLGRYPTLERRISRAIEALHRRNRTGSSPPFGLVDARRALGEERLVKDAAAIASLRRAVDITTEGHLAAMRIARPGVHEFELQAELEYVFRRRGASGPGYGSIVGTGSNATILHYVDNDAVLADGDLVLIDAGAEWDLFTADLTRTFPASGRFTPAQRDLYEVVRRANEAAIAGVVVGGTIDDVHRTALEHLVDGMLALGLVEGPRDRVFEDETYKAYYMHRTSHWLGADVHDVGAYSCGGKARPLVPGHVLTVEPGLYVAADDASVAPEFRGIGIRIEDDVLVTDEGPEVLTYGVPKAPDELERWLASDPRSGA